MKKASLASAIRSMALAMKRHSPEILTGIGIAGMITTVILAVKVTPKALILIEEEKKEREADKLTPAETVKTAGLCYLPAAITGGMSVLCLIGANSVNLRRNAALATAYTLSESALKEYRDKVIETIGEKKEQSVRDSIAKDRLEKNPVKNCEVIITERGNTLCYDMFSGRYFKSDMDRLKKAQNELNRQMIDDMYVSLNDFYYEIGLNNTSMGDNLGWNIDKDLVDLQFSSQLSEDGTPCLAMDFRIPPRYDFRY